jgi:hypothetical protein
LPKNLLTVEFPAIMQRQQSPSRKFLGGLIRFAYQSIAATAVTSRTFAYGFFVASLSSGDLAFASWLILGVSSETLHGNEIVC